MAVLATPFLSRASAFLVATAVFTAPLTATATPPPGAATPEALVARMAAAAEAGDVREAVACLAPDDRAEMAIAMLVATTMMVAFMEIGTEMGGAMAGMAEALTGAELDAAAEAELAAGIGEAKASGAAMQARLDEVLERHGVDRLMEGEPLDLDGDPAAARKALAGIDDVALIGDLLGLLESLGDGEGGSLTEALAVGAIELLTVEGDRGTARAGDQHLDLVRIDDRWYFEAPEATAAVPLDSE